MAFLFFYGVVMKYIKNLILSLKEIFIMMFLHYLILVITILIFGMNKAIILGSIFLCVLEIIYIVYKIRNDKLSFKSNNYLPYVLLGIGIASSYNMLLFFFNIRKDITTDINIIFNIICSGIIGPVFEEVLFRYSFINYLEKFNNNKKVIIISSIVFALCHTAFDSMIFALIIGFTNSYLYVKKRNILIPIVIHVSANIFVNFLYDFNIYILLLSLVLIIIGIIIIKKEEIDNA